MYEKFAQLLSKNNMTTYEFCKQAEVSESTISMWKSRNSIASALLLRKVAKFFGVTIEDLLPDE